MGEFYEKMDEDLKLANFTDDTRRSYLKRSKAFVRFFNKPPTELGEQEVRLFLRHLREERKSHPGTLAGYLSAITFLYARTLKRPEVVADIPRPKVPRSLPEILTREEVFHILKHVRLPRDRMLLAVAYGAGLRVSEACALKFSDINRKRGLIHICKGKGQKDRYVMLSRRLLHMLEDYYKVFRPPGPYFFPGRRPDRPIRRSRPSIALSKAMREAGVKKQVTPHSLRHAFATHLLEDGNDIRVIQRQLGHSSIQTTARYTQVSAKHIAGIESPFDAGFEKPQAH